MAFRHSSVVKDCLRLLRMLAVVCQMLLLMQHIISYQPLLMLGCSCSHHLDILPGCASCLLHDHKDSRRHHHRFAGTASSVLCLCEGRIAVLPLCEGTAANHSTTAIMGKSQCRMDRPARSVACIARLCHSRAMQRVSSACLLCLNNYRSIRKFCYYFARSCHFRGDSFGDALQRYTLPLTPLSPDLFSIGHQWAVHRPQRRRSNRQGRISSGLCCVQPLQQQCLCMLLTVTEIQSRRAGLARVIQRSCCTEMCLRQPKQMPCFQS